MHLEIQSGNKSTQCCEKRGPAVFIENTAFIKASLLLALDDDIRSGGHLLTVSDTVYCLHDTKSEGRFSRRVSFAADGGKG